MEEPEQLRDIVVLVARIADVARAQLREPPVQFIETLAVSMGEGVGIQGRCASGCVLPFPRQSSKHAQENYGNRRATRRRCDQRLFAISDWSWRQIVQTPNSFFVSMIMVRALSFSTSWTMFSVPPGPSPP